MSEEEVYVDGRPLSELKVVDLKKELDKRNLSKSGVKNVLADRLRQYILEQESDSVNGGGGGQKAEPVKEAPAAAASNPLIAEYLAKQQQALQEQQKVAAEARAAASPNTGDSPARNGQAKRRVEEPVEEPVAEAAVHEAEPKAEVAKEQQAPTKAQSADEELPHKTRGAGKRREEAATVVQEEEEEDAAKDAADEPMEQDDEEDARRSESPAQKAESDNGSSKEQSEERSESPENQEEPDDSSTTQDDAEDLDKLREAAKKSVEHKKRESPNKGDSEPKTERKRKWGSTRSAKRPAAVAISTDSLKDMMKEADEVEQKVELDYDDEHIEQNKPKRIVVAENDDTDDAAPNDDEPVPAKRVVVERRVSLERDAHDAGDDDVGMNGESSELTTEDGLRRRRAASPARYPVDRVLHIRCLTRPFTNKALLELLGKYGNVSSEEFWIDTIKTNCLVKFDTPEEAELARTRLHNVIWPSSNPKCLRVDFATQDVLDRHLSGEKKEETPKTAEKDQSRTARDERRRRSRSGERSEGGRQVKASREKEGGEREWDKGKELKPGQSPPKDGRRGRSSRSPARRAREERAQEAKPPAKLLDDLFHKTKAIPSIYWLPLTDEQAAQRTKQKAEEKAKQAEVSTNRDRDRRAERTDRGGDRADRRSPPRRRRSPSPPARRR